ncbi:Hypothetical protein NTJ_13562 [Nesidiocoris tenuis]|uniref:Uncharacterized protein n=1 Tax=Nesidiocoris tenuis TaxID=355587 RepID=A0ABN7B8M9_9HEMI|nr:Hypothetical protein NTJ_13562 [Nesidiocoris tenuis]
MAATDAGHPRQTTPMAKTRPLSLIELIVRTSSMDWAASSMDWAASSGLGGGRHWKGGIGRPSGIGLIVSRLRSLPYTAYALCRYAPDEFPDSGDFPEKLIP